MKQVSNIIDIIYLRTQCWCRIGFGLRKTCVPPLAPLPVSSKAWPNNMEIIIPIHRGLLYEEALHRTLTLNHANLSIRPFSSHPFLHPTSINSQKRILETAVKICAFSLQVHTFAPNPTETYIPIQIIWAISLYSYNFQTSKQSPKEEPCRKTEPESVLKTSFSTYKSETREMHIVIRTCRGRANSIETLEWITNWSKITIISL